jgi:magnesium transporter
MTREITAGLALGSLLGILGFARIAAWANVFGSYGPHYLLIGAAVSFAIVGVVMWGTLAGSMLPLILRRFGLDPATSCAPFVATLVDVTGLIIYFSAAVFLLKGKLL